MQFEETRTKVVGIPGYLNETSFGAGKTYLSFIEYLGYKPRILMPWEEFVEVDMLLLPGGLDLSPTSYDEVPSFYTQNHDVMKEFFFRKRLKTYIDNKVPIVGICLGMQMLNVFFGGSLEQHLLSHPESAGRRVAAHEIEFCKIAQKKGKNYDKGDLIHVSMPVNSHHHQGVLVRQLAEPLEVIAVENCDGMFEGKVVEIFRHKELPILGIQHHPEEWHTDYVKSLVKGIMGERENPIAFVK